MSNRTNQPWDLLFPNPTIGQPSITLEFRLVRKQGQPLLLLPTHKVAAKTSLSLYPAQSWKARAARSGLGWLQRVGVMPGTRLELRINLDSPLARFLCLRDLKWENLTLAMLLGNPHTAGQRFVILVFDSHGNPRRVVKAGVRNERALELLRHEAQFLKTIPASTLRAPLLQDTYDQDGIAALALDYAPGQTPKAGDNSSVPQILDAWLSREKQVPFHNLAAARRLAKHARPDAATQRALQRVSSIAVVPAIHHGDFAPWNIRVHPATKAWTVLDWERGEPAGPPAWDWFHYVIQPEVLVRRAQPRALIERFAQLCNEPVFMHYANQAGIRDHLAELFLGYAIYCRDVTCQSEGMPTIEGMVELLTSRTPA